MFARCVVSLKIICLLCLLSSSATAQETEVFKPKEFIRIANELARGAQFGAKQHVQTQHAMDKQIEQQIIRAKKQPEVLFQWAQQNIAFEPYQGALRGAQGVLDFKSANAPDMAILLAKLYKKAGYKTRFATAQLTNKQANALLLKFAGKDTLEGAMPPQFKRPTAFPNAQVQLVQQHVWLEIARDGTSWQIVDPILSTQFGSTPTKRIKTSTTMFDWAKASLNISIEATYQDRSTTTPVTVAGGLDTFANQTISLTFSAHDTLKDAKYPIIQVGDKSFTGKYVATEKLTSLSLNFDLKIDAQRRVWRETIYQASTGLNIFKHEHTQVSIAVIPGWTNDQMVAAIGQATMQKATTQLKKWANANKTKGSNELATQYLLSTTAPLLPYALARHFDRLVQRLAKTMGLSVVLRAPRVILTSIVRDKDKFYLQADIQGDQLEAIAALGIPQQVAQGFLMMYGRLEDAIKTSLLPNASGSPGVTTSKIFDAMTQNKIPVMTVHTTNLKALNKRFKGALETRLHLQLMATKHGATLLAPVRRVKTPRGAQFGWWRFDALTHSLHGQLDTGLFAPIPTNTTQKVTTTQLIQSATIFVTRQLSTWLTALKGTQEVSKNMCLASSNLRSIGRAMCATTRAIALPSLSECLLPTKRLDNDNPLAIQAPTCQETTRVVRCGAVIAKAFVSGKLYRSSQKQLATLTNDKGEAVSKMVPPTPICP